MNADPADGGRGVPRPERPGEDDDEAASHAGTDPDSDGDIPDLYPRIVNRADYDPAFDPAAPIVCERCGAVMHYTHNCRIVCDRCGYTRDCSDP